MSKSCDIFVVRAVSFETDAMRRAVVRSLVAPLLAAGLIGGAGIGLFHSPAERPVELRAAADPALDAPAFVWPSRPPANVLACPKNGVE